MIASPKRGSGKSTILSNLAFFFAAQGKKVGVLDAKDEFPFLFESFKMEKVLHGKCTFDHYLRGECGIDAVDLLPVTEFGAQFEDRIWLIPRDGLLSSQYFSNFDIDQIKEGINRIIENLGVDYLLVETSMALTESNLSFYAFADVMLTQFRLDHQEFQITGVMQEIAKMLLMENILVVNGAPSKYDQAQLKVDLRKVYGSNNLVIFPFAEAVVDVGIAESMYLREAGHAWSVVLAELGNRIQGFIDAE